MNDKKTIRNILIGLGIVIAALFAYSIIAPSESLDGSTKTGLASLLDSSALEQIEETDANAENAKILKVLGGIQNIQLKDDIFINPVFKKLKDSNFNIPNPVIVGRQNPFLPIGFEALLSSPVVDSQTLIQEQTIDDSFFTNTTQENLLDINELKALNGF